MMPYALADGNVVDLRLLYNHDDRTWALQWRQLAVTRIRHVGEYADTITYSPVTGSTGEWHYLLSGQLSAHDTVTEGFDIIRGKTLPELVQGVPDAVS